jgi:hypothetical protein
MMKEQDPDGDVLVCWYADESALPDIFWARLQINTGGSAEVLDCDGTIHPFETVDCAKSFLSEDEYIPFHELVEEGRVSDDIEPPPSFHSYDELRPLMKVTH